MSAAATDNGFASDIELRQRNRSTVQNYLDDIKGERRLERYRLYAEDARAMMCTTDNGEPIVITGLENLKDHAKWSLEVLPDWVWYNVEIIETQDPNQFWVECDGEGKIIFPGYPVGHYRNHFLHHFQLEDGRIKQNREFMNPCMQMHALGVEVPTIKREGLPAD